jgi:hypothetical protein
VLALHQQSLAESVTKLLAESGALSEFNNMSNPLFGTQSVTQSQTDFGAGFLQPGNSAFPVPGAPQPELSDVP